MNKILALITVSIILISCNSTSSSDSHQESAIDNSNARIFWNSLKELQGKSYEGQLANAPADNDFEGKQLVMHVLYSDDETILIPFNVGENLSRTWIFKYKDGRIELKHDHRMKDGTDDELTMYGGTSTNEGKAWMQVFPADQETVAMLPEAFSNVWWVTVDNTTFTYNLRRVGTDRLFTVVFDLTHEIEKPSPSWGWEDFQGIYNKR
jgi:hypothetical protein